MTRSSLCKGEMLIVKHVLVRLLILKHGHERKEKEQNYPKKKEGRIIYNPLTNETNIYFLN